MDNQHCLERGLRSHLREDATMSNEKPLDVMTLNEVAEYLRIPRSTTYKLAQEGKLPGQKVGRHWRFHKQAVEDWLKQYRTAKDEDA